MNALFQAKRRTGCGTAPSPRAFHAPRAVMGGMPTCPSGSAAYTAATSGTGGGDDGDDQVQQHRRAHRRTEARYEQRRDVHGRGSYGFGCPRALDRERDDHGRMAEWLHRHGSAAGADAPHGAPAFDAPGGRGAPRSSRPDRRAVASVMAAASLRWCSATTPAPAPTGRREGAGHGRTASTSRCSASSPPERRAGAVQRLEPRSTSTTSGATFACAPNRSRLPIRPTSAVPRPSHTQRVLGLSVTAAAATTDYCRAWIEYSGDPTKQLDLTKEDDPNISGDELYATVRHASTAPRGRCAPRQSGWAVRPLGVFANGGINMGGSFSVPPVATAPSMASRHGRQQRHDRRG
jgi:hypothetical protein